MNNVASTGGLKAWMAMGLALGLAASFGVEAASKKKEKQRQQLSEEVSKTVVLFENVDDGMKKFFETSAGYAVFPKVTKGAMGIGAARGEGQLYEKGKVVGGAHLTQITIGAQLGGQVYAEVVFFENADSLQAFKDERLKFSAQVSAVAAAEGASKNAKYELGVAVFTLARGGVMFEASVGGQKFDFEPYEDE